MASPAGGVIEATNTIMPSFGPLRNAGAPVAGTDEVQTLTIGGTPSAGATSGIKFTFQGLTSALCLWSATSATFVTNLQACLDAFLGSGATVVTDGTSTNGVGTFIITFSGALLAKTNMGAAMGVINALTGTAPTASVARTTPGVTATFRNAAVGQLLIDTTNKLVFQNQGTLGAPNWVGIV